MKKILLLILIAFSYALTQTTDSFEILIKNKLVQKKLIDQNEQFDIKTLGETSLTETVGKYNVYEIKTNEYPYPDVYHFIEKNGVLYLMSDDFNKLVLSEGVSINSDNIGEYAKEFIQLLYQDEITFEEENNQKFKFLDMVWNFSVISWRKRNGIKQRWYFQVRNGQFSAIRSEVIAIEVGDYVLDEKYEVPPVGLVQYFNPEFVSVTEDIIGELDVENSIGENISFEDNYQNPIFYKYENVVVYRNGAPTSSVERTIKIKLRNFTPNTTVTINILYDYNSQSITLKTINVNTNLLGNAEYSWELPVDIPTGKLTIRANDNLLSDIESFFAYREKNGSLPNAINYSYKIRYISIPFIDNNDAENFGRELEQAIKDVYNQVVNLWGFPSPQSIESRDPNFLDIFVTTKEKENVAYSHPNFTLKKLLFDEIEIGANFIKDFSSTYIKRINVIQSVIAHEFFHTIEFNYPDYILTWQFDGLSKNDGDDDFVTEGLATFIQTIYMQNHSVDTPVNPEYIVGSMYHKYLEKLGTQKYISSLKKRSYDFSIFWRFLYEKWEKDSKLNIIKNLLSKLNDVGNSEIKEFSRIMKELLIENNFKNYSNFLEFYLDFVKALIFNNEYYGKWDYNPDNFYWGAFTIPFDDYKTISSNTIIAKKGNIENSFGVRYYSYIFQKNISKIIIKFNGDPDNDNEMANFAVRVFLLDNDFFFGKNANIVFEQDVSLTNNYGEISFDVGEGIENAVVVVTRIDDREEEGIDNDYEITLTPEIDVINPTISITNPIKNTTVSGTVNITTNAFDNESGLNRVEFYINSEKVFSDTEAPWEYEWNTSGYQNGSYQLRAVAIDNGGNIAEDIINVNLVNILELYNGSVSPQTGSTDDTYEFNVYYRSANGTSPGNVLLYIDKVNGSPFIMNATGQDWINGVKFTKSLNITTPGTYSYYFQTTVGTTILRFPENGSNDLSVNQSAQGWDIRVTDISASPTYADPGDRISVSGTIHNNSNASDKIYYNLSYTFYLYDKNGNIIDQKTGNIPQLNPANTKIVYSSFILPNNIIGNAQIVLTIHPTLDENYSDNSASKVIVVGSSGPSKQWYISSNNAWVEMSASYPVHNFYGSNYRLWGVGKDSQGTYASIQQDGGRIREIYDGYFRMYNSQYVVVINEFSDRWNQRAFISFGSENTNYVTFENTNVTGHPGERIEFIAYCNSNTFSNTDPDFYQGTDIENWFYDLNIENNGHKAIFIFKIPSSTNPGTYNFYMASRFPNNAKFLRELSITVIDYPPQISSVNKTTFSADDQITIQGSHFGSNGSVKFNNLVATEIVSWNNNTIICKVPDGVQDGNLIIQNNNGVSNAISYKVISSTGDPEIISHIPDNFSLIPGDSLLITDLTKIFKDPNGDKLQFVFQSSSSSITANSDSLNKGILYIETTKEAMDTIENVIIARDAESPAVTDTFLLGFIDITSPPAPSNLIINFTNNMVELTWDPSYSSDFAGYRIYRGINQEVFQIYKQIFSFNPEETNFVDKNLTAGNTYFYRVTSFDKNGNESFPSNIVKISINAPPKAINDIATTNEDVPIVIDVLKNDVDKENDSLRIVEVENGNHGYVQINESKTLTYFPDKDFFGNDKFSYMISDNNGGFDTAFVFITIDPVNDYPVIVDSLNNVSYPEDYGEILLYENISRMFSDPDFDDTLIYFVSSNNSNISVNLDGYKIILSSSTNFYGEGEITIGAKDKNGASVSQKIKIIITPVNDPPVAVSDSAVTTEDVAVTIDVLTNDSDVENDVLVIASVTQGAHGGVAINANNTVTYTPQANYNGFDQFSYVVSDGNGGLDTANVYITIKASNDAPLVAHAIKDITVAEDFASFVAVDLDTVFSDADGDSLRYTAQSVVGHVLVQLSGSKLTLGSTPNWNGVDSVIVSADDGVASSSDTFLVAVTPVNDPPVAVSDTVSTVEDTPVEIDVLFNDSDVENDLLVVASVTQGSHGSVSINSDNTVSYTPQANYNGFDQFRYVVSDGNGGLDTADVYVTIKASNDPPVVTHAIKDITVAEDFTSFVAADLDTVFSDADRDPLSYSAQSVGGHVLVQLIGSKLTLSSTPNWNGVDSVIVSADDGVVSSSDTFLVAVTPVNDPPVAVSDSAVTTEDVAVTIDVLANDSDVENDLLVVASVTQGSHGSVSINSDNTVSYTPQANFNGADQFRYVVSDGNGGLDTADVYVTIKASNDPPVVDHAIKDIFVAEDFTSFVAVNLDTVFSDADGDSLRYTAQSVGGHVLVQLSGSQLTLGSTPDWNGVDSVIVSADDGVASSSDTFLVEVTPVNDPPVAVSDTVSTVEDTPVEIDVLFNDSDVENDLLVVASVTQGSHGSVSINSVNTVSYTPQANYNGFDQFRYVVSDGNGGLDTGTVYIIITPENDSPIISNLPILSWKEDDTLKVVANFWYSYVEDPDNADSTLSFQIIFGKQVKATVQDSNYIFFAPPNWFGSDTLQLIVSDGFLADTADLYIEVKPVNDPPQITNLPQSISFEADTSYTLLLWDYVSDIETSDSLLNYRFASKNDSLKWEYNSRNGALKLFAETGYVGTTRFFITVSDDSNATASDTIHVAVSPVTGIEEQLANMIPRNYVLFQNYPNPFNPVTHIRFGLPRASRVRIEIFNILGQRVATLLDGRKPAGYYEVLWDASQMSSGIYIYRIKAGDFVDTKKMILMR